jgi:hypothetical protein
MTILNKYKKWDRSLIINESNILDFILSKDNVLYSDDNKGICTCINMAEGECVDGSDLVSLKHCAWNNAVNDGISLKNIGFTAIDSGYITFNGVEINNEVFFNILTKSELNIDKNDYRLILKPTNSSNLIYDFSYNINKNDSYIQLKGGFFQGFYKLYGYDYQILPSTINKSWELKFKICPRNYEVSEKTLNTIHPNNKGIFFYMGTRSENKFLEQYNYDFSLFEKRNMETHMSTMCDNFYDGYYYDSSNSNENDGYFIENDYLNPEKDIINETVIDTDGVDSKTEGYYEIKTNNKYLFFNNANDGFNTDTWNDNDEVVLTLQKEKKTPNLYLLLNNTKDGYNTETINDYYENNKPQKITFNDITNNAFALKVNDDGSIGYRYLIANSEEEYGFEMVEEYSKPSIIKTDEWNDIDVKIKTIGENLIKIYFYIGGKLKFISKELPNFNFRELNEYKTKQEGVPYNISLGGGTMGLCNSMWLKYYNVFEYVLPIEKYFAGTFIGDIKYFSFSEE